MEGPPKMVVTFGCLFGCDYLCPSDFAAASAADSGFCGLTGPGRGAIVGAERAAAGGGGRPRRRFPNVTPHRLAP